MSDKLNGVFVTASGFLNGRPGGAQHCTAEYIETLTAAGVDLHILSFELDRRVSSRLLKKIWPSSYVRHNEPGLIGRIRVTVERTNSQFVFLNQVQLAPLAEKLRSLLRPGCKIVVLSHGLESTDLLHTLRFSSDPPIELPKYVFGRQLLTDSLRRECAYRPHLDLILCLSTFDVELEHWLGATNAVWVRSCSWHKSGATTASYVATAFTLKAGRITRSKTCSVIVNYSRIHFSFSCSIDLKSIDEHQKFGGKHCSVRVTWA